MPHKAHAIRPSGFFETLFAPESSIKKNKKAVPVKDGLDHIDQYVRTSRGAWDVFRVIREPFYYLNHLPSIGQAGKDLIGKVTHVMTAAGTALSIPKLISDTNTVRKSIQKIHIASKSPYSDPHRSTKIGRSCKDAFANSMNLTNTVAEAGLYLHHVKLVAWNAIQLRCWDGVYNGSSIISDGMDLLSQGYQLKHLQELSSTARKSSQKAELENKKTLTQMAIATDISSIAFAAISLVGITFSIALESVTLIPELMLALGTTWLVLKIACHFYQKIVVEAPPLTHSRTVRI